MWSKVPDEFHGQGYCVEFQHKGSSVHDVQCHTLRDGRESVISKKSALTMAKLQHHITSFKFPDLTVGCKFSA